MVKYTLKTSQCPHRQICKVCLLIIFQHYMNERVECVQTELTFFLSVFIANCRANATAMEQCGGEMNTCVGTVNNYVCVCEDKGWKLNTADKRYCLPSRLLLISRLPFSFTLMFSKIYFTYLVNLKTLLETATAQKCPITEFFLVHVFPYLDFTP